MCGLSNMAAFTLWEQVLPAIGTVVATHSLVALRQVESSRTKLRSSALAGGILQHWTTKEVLVCWF